ncbi:GNAT family N-acetyltransferase [Bacillus marinisedimentorum]|uniref:GNAT family N-acetyltransferase n=1 Tax=Bacillus marinisedimentorum TaxID=1821260 RepID=UPI0007E01A12|nr:GNAT family N-acetyltransferase [Bacillus marinisedimentorum]
MTTFERITENTLKTALDIVNSNQLYNKMENGQPLRSMSEIRKDFLNPVTESFIIMKKQNPIGVLDFLPKNPKDDTPWLGLLMIHGKYHGFGFGKKAYLAFENRLKQHLIHKVRLGVLQKNERARMFWESFGFCCYGESEWEGKAVDCYEKRLDCGVCKWK